MAPGHPLKKLLLVMALVVLGAYGWMVWKNVDGATRAAKACAQTEAHVDGLLDATAEWLDMLASNPDHVRELMRSAITRPCDVVQQELTWWKPSFGRSVTIDMDPGGELARAGRELALRCPDVMRDTLREGFLAERTDEIVREVCGQIESSLTVGGTTTQSLSLWGWVDELEAREEMLRPPQDSVR